MSQSYARNDGPASGSAREAGSTPSLGGSRGRRWWPAPPRSRDASAQFLSPDTNDPDFTTSTSTALSQTVSKASTTAAVLSSANPSVVGQSVTFTTTISVVAPGGGTPTGT